MVPEIKSKKVIAIKFFEKHNHSISIAVVVIITIFMLIIMHTGLLK